MPTRKQRRRRDKTFRHEYETVLIDEEGNETPLAELRTHDEPKHVRNGSGSRNGNGAKSSGNQKSSGKGSRRPVRPVPEPSWERALKRGGTWGVVMLVVSVFFLFRTAPIAERVLLGLMYAIAFVPLTYFVDRTAYRAYVRRSSAPQRVDKQRADKKSEAKKK